MKKYMNLGFTFCNSTDIHCLKIKKESEKSGKLETFSKCSQQQLYTAINAAQFYP